MKSSSSLLWRCRRGIREMDILLQGFLEKYFDVLSAEEKKTFEQLLEETDMDIMAWIMDKAPPPSEEFAKMIQLIRKVNPTNK